MQVRAEKLSHQDVTGVGYGICIFYPEYSESLRQGAPHAGDLSAADHENRKDRHFLDQYLAVQAEKAEAKREGSDAYVRLARETIERYIGKGELIRISGSTVKCGQEELPMELPDEMLNNRAGAFVSIHKQGSLRGCIGTIAPTAGCVAQEIINNAVSASVRDPRFSAIRPDELKYLEINVDVLGEAEDIDSEAQLDVKRYGVIVTSGHKRGLLLPDLDGVDTVEQQVSIAKQKGGIRPGERYKLQRFEVIRHFCWACNQAKDDYLVR